jgi:hypothetical protein
MQLKIKYLWSNVKSIAVTQSHRLRVGSDCHVCNIHPRLTTSNNQHILADTELPLLLEIRRMHDHGNIAKTLDWGNIGSDMQARADGYCIAIPETLLSQFQVMYYMTTFLATFDFGNRSIEVDVGLETEVLRVAFEVYAILFRGEEVWRTLSIAVVGEGRQLSGRHQLHHR